MDLEIGIRLGAIQYSLRIDIRRAFGQVGGSFGRIEVGLTFLKVLDLAGGILCAREAAMQTPHLCTLVEVSMCTAVPAG